MKRQRWQKEVVGGEDFEILNLAHPSVEKRVIAEMEEGVEVYYDRRWSVTSALTDWLGKNRTVFEGKRVLVLGAGVGAETLLLGKQAAWIGLNDLAPTALELCAEQMERNGLPDYRIYEGRYEELDFPAVDVVVGSFLIYNDDTYAAMEDYLGSHSGTVILVNERLAPFPKFLERHSHEVIFEDETGAVGVLLKLG